MFNQYQRQRNIGPILIPPEAHPVVFTDRSTGTLYRLEASAGALILIEVVTSIETTDIAYAPHAGPILVREARRELSIVQSQVVLTKHGSDNVAEGAGSHVITHNLGEVAAVFKVPNWLTRIRTGPKTVNGETVVFEFEAPAGAQLDWKAAISVLADVPTVTDVKELYVRLFAAAGQLGTEILVKGVDAAYGVRHPRLTVKDGVTLDSYDVEVGDDFEQTGVLTLSLVVP